MQIYFLGKENDRFVDLANENWIHDEHDEVHQSAWMDMVDV